MDSLLLDWQAKLEPFHFGSSERRLFGVYHPPLPDADRGIGVVLCHPIGQEYIRSHRAFLRLAIRLSEAGFYILRFDLTGCGDSEHDFEQGDLRRWSEDAATALRELREGSAVARLCFVGLRLGGSIAAITAAEQNDVEGLVLWDPVIDGRQYLREIRSQHHEWLRGSFVRAQRSRWRTTVLTAATVPSAPESTCEEVLGFPLSEALRTSLERLNLLRLDAVPATRALLMDTQRKDSSTSLLERFRELGTDAESQHILTPPVWVKQKDELGNVTVPAAVLDALVGWMDKCFS